MGYKRQHQKKLFEKHMGIKPEDILIVQPTRVASNKRIDKALLLADAIQMEYKRRRQNKKVFLVVSGGREIGLRNQIERRKLEALADELNFQQLIFLGGTGKIADYLNAADLITYMSRSEG